MLCKVVVLFKERFEPMLVAKLVANEQGMVLGAKSMASWRSSDEKERTQSNSLCLMVTWIGFLRVCRVAFVGSICA